MKCSGGEVVTSPPLRRKVGLEARNITHPRKMTKKIILVLKQGAAQQGFAVMSCTARMFVVISLVDNWY